jgi:Asp-tRNA(Asn)/Glu-tRNA(Gln) amidotransferase A subunit family amidase
MPVGLQIVGAPGEDARTIAIAERIAAVMPAQAGIQ